jgi:metal-sulfur cluster biosynthetic enzyme
MDALSTVFDPELDEPITRLGFVRSCEVSPAGEVQIALRLPTPQCAPNFAFLMAADARGAVRRLPEVGGVTIRLDDHYTGEEINAAVARDEGFAGAFPGETEDDELQALRLLFVRKALVARQSRLCESLVRHGVDEAHITARTVADLGDSPEARRCLALREQLGLDCAPDAPAFVRPDGEPLQATELRRWMRMARLVRMSLEVNGGICRSLINNRYGLAIEDPEEVVT